MGVMAAVVGLLLVAVGLGVAKLVSVVRTASNTEPRVSVVVQGFAGKVDCLRNCQGQGFRDSKRVGIFEWERYSSPFSFFFLSIPFIVFVFLVLSPS